MLPQHMETDKKVTHISLDSHKKSSKVTVRNAEGKVLWRQRLEHANPGEGAVDHHCRVLGSGFHEDPSGSNSG